MTKRTFIFEEGTIMKVATGVVFGMIWMILVLLIGFLVITNVVTHANDSEQLTGDAGTAWETFITFVWVAMGLLAFTPLILLVAVFGGLGVSEPC